VRSGAVYLYIVSLSGRKLTLPYITPGSRVASAFQCKPEIFQNCYLPSCTSSTKTSYAVYSLKHMKLIKILFKNSVSTLEEITVDAVNENYHCFL
jgi:hypothetical protein